MNSYITQYKTLFFFSWIALYLIFPSWISMHTVFHDRGLLTDSYALARALAIFGVMLYFSISAYLLTFYFRRLAVDKPLIVKINNWSECIKDNLWLVVLCALSAVLHIYPLSMVPIVIGGGEMPYIYQISDMYDVLNSYWYGLFNIPIQYLFWSIIILLILLAKQKNMISSMSDRISTRFSRYESKNLMKFFFIAVMFGFFCMYSYLFPYYSRSESLPLLRYPPVSRLPYLINFLAFGFSYIGPRIVQLIFYLLSAVYLYRIILLFLEKETALLGATIYLFSPIMFSFASRAAFASGTVFFIIITSFHFLRFIKNEDDRDLILTTYFIGMGFLYKRALVLMFVICFAYLILSRIKKRDLGSIIHFKVMLLSLVPILPWLKIGPSMYFPVWSNLITYTELVEYFMMFKDQASMIMFLLLLFSFVFALVTRKNDMTKYFGLFFVAYYLFFTLTEQGDVNHRFVMALYPAIAVFIAQFIFAIIQKIKWKHTFRLVFSLLTVYLAVICLIPRSSSSLITYKYKDFESQYYPVDKATDWIKEKTEKNEKILVLHMSNYGFYLEKIYEGKNDINPNRFLLLTGDKAKELLFPQNLREYCYDEKISYIILPFSPKNSLPGKHFEKRKEMVAYFVEQMGMDNNGFVEVGKFSLDDNYILIYKPRGNTVYLKEWIFSSCAVYNSIGKIFQPAFWM